MTSASEEGRLPVLDGLRVLVVDDAPDEIELLRFVFERAGADVTTAETAQEGYLALRRSHPNVLVSDVSLPDESGLELMRRIRALSPEEGGTVRAVAFTAWSSEPDRIEAFDAGFDEYCVKPCPPSELVAIVARVAAGRDRGLA